MSTDTELTPLEEIEQHVQTRAKDIATDLSENRADEILAPLVTEAIQTWNEDFRLGTRPHALNNPDLVAQRALRNRTGYGPLPTTGSARHDIDQL